VRPLIIVCALGVAACAAPHVVWEHPGQDTATAERQREIDSAECLAIATQVVSLPAEAAQTRVNVNFRGFDQSQVGDSGQLTATGSEIEAQKIRIAALKEADTERQVLNDACMEQRGWMKNAR